MLFVAATLLATALLVLAGLSERSPGPQVGWFETSQE